MKTCPICKSKVFDDMEVCYGCMYRFARRTIDEGAFRKVGGSEVVDEPQFDEPIVEEAVSVVAAPSHGGEEHSDGEAGSIEVARDVEGAEIQTSMGEVVLPVGQAYRLVITLEPVISSCGSSAQADRGDRGRTPSCRE